MDKKLFHIVWIGAVAVLTLVGVVFGLRSGDVTVYDREYTWFADAGPEGDQSRLLRGRKVQSIQQDWHKLVFAFNKVFRDTEAFHLAEGETRLELPKLVIGEVGRSIARIRVENSMYLTQRMGSAGARDFLAAATYTLTECPAIGVVDFDFPEGDHAAPGIYSRESFTDYRKVYFPK